MMSSRGAIIAPTSIDACEYASGEHSFRKPFGHYASYSSAIIFLFVVFALLATSTSPSSRALINDGDAGEGHSAVLLPLPFTMAHARLLKAVLIHRHGARTSAGVIDGVIHYNAPFGILSHYGGEQCRAIGAYVRRRYGEVLAIPTNYSVAGLQTRSTAVERVILSAQRFLEGLFPDDALSVNRSNESVGGGGGRPTTSPLASRVDEAVDGAVGKLYSRLHRDKDDEAHAVEGVKSLSEVHVESNAYAIRRAMEKHTEQYNSIDLSTRHQSVSSTFRYPPSDAMNLALSPWNANPSFVLEDRHGMMLRRMANLTRAVLSRGEMERIRREVLELEEGACDATPYFCIELLQDIYLADISRPELAREMERLSSSATPSSLSEQQPLASDVAGSTRNTVNGAVNTSSLVHKIAFVTVLFPKIQYLQAVFVNTLVGYGLPYGWTPRQLLSPTPRSQVGTERSDALREGAGKSEGSAMPFIVASSSATASKMREEKAHSPVSRPLRAVLPADAPSWMEALSERPVPLPASPSSAGRIEPTAHQSSAREAEVKGSGGGAHQAAASYSMRDIQSMLRRHAALEAAPHARDAVYGGDSRINGTEVFPLAAAVLTKGGRDTYTSAVGSLGIPWVREVLAYFREGLKEANGTPRNASSSGRGGARDDGTLIGSRFRHYAAHDYTLTAIYGALGSVMFDNFDDADTVPRFADSVILELHQEEDGGKQGPLVIKAFIGRPTAIPVERQPSSSFDIQFDVKPLRIMCLEQQRSAQRDRANNNNDRAAQNGTFDEEGGASVLVDGTVRGCTLDGLERFIRATRSPLSPLGACYNTPHMLADGGCAGAHPRRVLPHDWLLGVGLSRRCAFYRERCPHVPCGGVEGYLADPRKGYGCVKADKLGPQQSEYLRNYAKHANDDGLLPASDGGLPGGYDAHSPSPVGALYPLSLPYHSHSGGLSALGALETVLVAAIIVGCLLFLLNKARSVARRAGYNSV